MRIEKDTLKQAEIWTREIRTTKKRSQENEKKHSRMEPFGKGYIALNA